MNKRGNIILMVIVVLILISFSQNNLTGKATDENPIRNYIYTTLNWYSCTDNGISINAEYRRFFKYSVKKFIYKDTCLSDNTLRDYSCDGRKPYYIEKNCENRCEDGGCKKYSNEGKCFYDSDCSSNEKCIFNFCMAKKTSSIAIFVGNDYKLQLSPEINRLKSDIIDDLSNDMQEVNVYIFDSWNTKEDIKNEILKLWRNENLIGVILIGDLPTYTFSSKFYPNGIPSDFYYIDVENTCDYPNTDKCTNYPRLWLGRITPPVKGADGINLVKNYLERNHNYRTGKISFNKDILVYFPDFIGFNSVQNLMTMETQDERIIYSFPPSTFITSRSEENYDRQYLQELQKPYEAVLIDAHGSPTFHRISINYNDIKDIEPKAMSYRIISCAVGKFTENNYLAGWYLFGGNGLVVQAATETVFGTISSDQTRDLNLLQRGALFGNVETRLQYSPIRTILGDPTLRLRYEKFPSNAELVVDKELIDFGEVDIGTKKNTTFTLYNKGSELVFFEFYESANSNKILKEPEYKIGGISPFKYYIECDWKMGNDRSHWGEIKPGSSVTCKITFSPVGKGEHEYILDIYSNSENNYWIQIPIIGKGV